MSRTIDERVVSMQFDNKQFEKNVQTSMSTIEKLKQSLNFSGASKGIENVNAAAKSFTLSPMGNAVEAVKMKFSALEVMAVTTLANITNSAVNAGKRIASALTIEPVRTGFQEYETQIGAVQTILANTQSKGSTLDDVNAALDELNTYADKTIYNFTEMTRNIGTFTAAGVELDKSVQSIKGIANLAAISGSTSQQASTAMYQLSQALAAGKVQLMDWNSVVNAGMGGEVFQTALKRTATQMGHNVDAMIEKYGSFRESLTQGEWLTAEVLTETLAQLSGAYTKADLIAQGYTEKQAEEIVKLAETAESAATDVKTFTQLMDTLKESAQSGWTSTWELIIGDFEEAKQLWSSVYKVFGGIIEASAEARNKVLAGALDSNWDKLTKKINEAGVQTTVFEDKIKEVAKSHNIDVDKIVEKYGSLEKAFQAGAISTDVLKEALNELGGSMVNLEGVRKNLKMGDTGEDVKKVQQALKELGYDLDEFGADGIIGKETTAAIKAFQEASGLEVTGIIDDKTLEALGSANNKLVKLKGSMGSLIDEVDKLGGRDLLIESFKNVFEALSRVIKPVKRAFEEVFPPITAERLYQLIEGFRDFTAKLKLTPPQVRRVYTAFKGVFEVIGLGWTFIKKLASGLWDLLGNFSGLGDGVISFAGKIGDLLSNFAEMIRSGDKIGVVVNAITGFIKSAIDKIKEFGKSIRAAIDEAGGFAKAFGLDGLFEYLSGGGARFMEFIKGFKSLDSLSLSNIRKMLTDFKTNVVDYFLNIDNPFKSIAEWAKGFGDRLNSVFEGAGEKFDWIATKISNFVTVVKEKLGDKMGSIVAVGILVGFLLLVKKIADVIGSLGDTVASFVGIFKNFSKSLTENFTNFFEALNTRLTAKNFKIKTEAFKNIAISIALLAGSVALLASMDPKTVWSSVGAIAALSVVMLGLSFALSKFEPGDFGKMSVSLLGLSGALLVFAIAAKAMGMVGWDELGKSGAVMLGFLATLAIASQILNRSKRDLNNFGSMMVKLSAALIIFGISARILGGMDTDTLVQGGAAVAIFLGMMAAMMGVTKSMAKNVPRFGSMMIGLSAALLLMSASVAILGTMEIRTIVQGSICVGIFLGMMAAMMAATSNLAKRLPKFGTMMLGLSAALLLMSASIAILGNMDPGTVLKGSIAVMGFMGIMVLLMKATELMGKNSASAAKIGVMMLSFAGGVLALTAAIALLGLMDEDKLKKAMSAIVQLALVFGALMIASKYASDFKGIIALSAAVGILAVSLAALSFIDPERLKSASLALTAVVGMFALLTAATKFMNNKSLWAIGIMTLVVGGLAFIIYELSKTSGDADTALKVATALSVLIASLAAACALVSTVGKIGNKAFIGVGVLGAVLGVLSVFAGIAIWQLPNIAKQLSSFMTELEPFLNGIKSVDAKALDGLKTLAEAIYTFTSAAGKHAVLNVLTLGGMTRAFSSFSEFIKEVVPVVKDLAVDISADNLNLDVDNINTIVDTIASLAEAANNVPSSTLAVAFTKFGAGAYISVPNLMSFTTWVSDVVPVVEDLATRVSSKGTNINVGNVNAIIDAIHKLAEAADKAPGVDVAAAFGKFAGGYGGGLYLSAPDLIAFGDWVKAVSDCMADFAGDIAKIELTESDVSSITSICESVGLLAEAADEAPGIEVAAAFAKFAKGLGGGAYVSIPNLTAFKDWIEGITPVMSDFAIDIKGSGLTESDANALSTICKSVEYLGIAAGSAPSMDVAAAFAAFPGGFGLGGYISLPQLTAFKSWIEQVGPVMSGFAMDIKDSELTESDANALSTICKSVEYLGIAAGSAPTIDVAAAFALVGPAIAAGTYVSVPNLEAFKDWIAEVVPIMSGFALDIKASTITEADASALSSICKAVEYLGIAAGNAPGYEIAAGFASIGPLIGAGGYVNIPDLEAFKGWIEEVVPIMSGFAIDVKEVGITAENASTLSAICQAVGYLGEAAKNAPGEEEAAAITLVGAATYVKSTDLKTFTDWISSVVPVISGFAIDIKEVGITSETATTLSEICSAATILADAAALAPKEETYSNIFGKWVSTSDFEDLKTWIKDMVGVLQEVSTDLAESNVAMDTAKLAAIANAGKVLADTVAVLVTTHWSYGSFDVDEFKTQTDEIADAMVSFSSKVAEVNSGEVAASAQAARDIAATLNILHGFNYSKVDVPAFSSKLDEIATAMSDFSEDLSGVDVGPAVSEVTGLSNLLSGMAYVNFSGASSFEKALGKLSKTGIEKFIKAFDDSKNKAINAAKTFVANCASGIHTVSTYIRFYSVGKYVVDGFASGITAQTWKAEAKAKAMANAAEKAAKDALKVNSPSKVFIPLGEAIPEGLALGIERLGGLVKGSAVSMATIALDGTKNAISRIADVINSDIDAQPTIRPVLDLSDVRSGAGAISSMFNSTPSLGLMTNVGAISSMMNGRQNGGNDDVISAIKELGRTIGGMRGDTYSINGITYDDGSNISEAVKSLVRAARVERRV